MLDGDFNNLWNDDEDVETPTSEEQCSCEETCSKFLLSFSEFADPKRRRLLANKVINEDGDILLLRDLHATYLERGLLGLPGSFVSLDASRPWICYWIVQALYLLKREPVHLYPRIISFLSQCQNSATTGGYGGGPGQMSHCAPTFAAVLALCSVGTPEALSSIDRAKVYSFFYSMKDEATGAFTMHRDGEADTRSVYTVLSVARLLNILTPELSQGCAEYLALCQSYEGGFGGEPGNEAHGGYNFCALASLLILSRTSSIDLDAQERWVQQRQMRLEGGFQGRTNKTVDSCYSYWQGAALALVNMIRGGGTDTHDLDAFVVSSGPSPARTLLPSDVDNVLDADDVQTALPIVSARDEGGSLPFNQKALQRYILHCGQNIEADHVGGLRDKPGKSRDYYHSCYALSGLSIAQRFHLPRKGGAAQVFGDPENLLEPTSAVFNIGMSKLRSTLDHFYSLPQPNHANLLGIS